MEHHVMQMKTVHANGIDMAIADQGEGPAVVLCHGFPGLAYCWRHQVAALAAAGYRAIAPDMRGIGGTDAPPDPADYDRKTTVADMTGLLDVLEIERAVFVGHDFGANLVWDLPQWAPERVAGVVVLSVPMIERVTKPPSETYAEVSKDHFYHMDYFQHYGPADRELNAAPADFLARIYWALSDADRWFTCYDYPAEGNGYLDVLPEAPELPWGWMTSDDFSVFVREYSRTGFTGGLNWYRAMDLVWRQNEHLAGATIDVPATFIAGTLEPVVKMFSGSLESMPKLVTDLRDIRLIEDAGHFVQMEKPAEVNESILNFLSSVKY
nr:alpha/beta hydrolase [Tomitella gaofuii]